MAHAHLTWCVLVVCACLLKAPPAACAQNLTINGAQTYQTIDGFGVNANHRSWTNDYLQPVIDAYIDQAGMTIFRIIVDNTEWESVNANPGPTITNWAYFDQVCSSPDLQKLWGLVAYLDQRGLSNGVMLNFQGYGPAWMLAGNGATLAPGNENAWAEMIAALLVYGRNNLQLQFSLVGPDNEEDFTSSVQGILTVDAAQYVTALHDLAQQLDANGLSDMRFAAPDMAYNNTSWWTTMMNDPVVMAKLGHFGLHAYVNDGGNYLDGGNSDGVYAFLQQSPYSNLDFWVTEFNVGCSTCSGGSNPEGWEYFLGTAQFLLAQLANGASAGLVWEGYDGYYVDDASANPGPNDYYFSAWGMFSLATKTPPTYTPRKNFYTVAQITKFVRPGAQRIAIAGSTSLQVLAFYQPQTGQLTLAGVNPTSSAITLPGLLTNLPAVGSLELYYTDINTNLCDTGAVPIVNGAFTATIPPSCAFALTGPTAVSVALTNPSSGTLYTAPATVLMQASASTVTGAIASVTFLNGSAPLAQVATPPYNFGWSNVPPGNYLLRAAATNSLGNSAVSQGVSVTVAGPLAQISLNPSNAAVAPFRTLQFTAIAADALGTVLVPQPTFTWSVSGGGSIDTNGLFTAGGTTGGPFLVTASSAEVSGTANLTITPSGLVAAYGFEEGSGSLVTDSSGNGNSGTISGGAAWTTGRFGGGLAFNGASAAVTIPDSASLDLSNALTVEAWVYPLAVNRWNPVLMKAGNGLNCYILQASTSTGPPAFYCSGFGGNLNAVAALPANAWSHVAATYDQTNAILYVNGSPVASAARNTPIVVSPGNLTIGFASPSYFLGTIDELRIYNRALSATDILGDMNTPVIVINQSPAISVAISNLVNGEYFSAPAAIPLEATVTAITGAVTTVTFFNGPNLLGSASAPPFSILWTNVPAGTYTLSVTATNTVGSLATSAPVTVVVAGQLAQVTVTPSNAPVAPLRTLQFTALAADALGTVLVPQPTFTWSVSGGGSINANGLFTAGGTTGGPFLVTASNAGISGTADLTITPNGLVAAYGFEEGSGSLVTDSSGNGNSGTISGGATWTTGRFGGGLAFNGASAAVTIPDSASLDLSNALTVESWVYPLAVNRWNPILMKAGNGLNCYILQASTSTGPPAFYCSGFGGNLNAVAALPANAWSHVAATYDQTNAILYVNGSPVASAAHNTAIVVSPGNLTIGLASPSYFLGTLDELRIYNRALSATDILGDMSTPVVGSLTNPPPPPLLFLAVGSNGLSLWWAGNLTNYGLQVATNLLPPVPWLPLTNTPQPFGTNQRVNVTPAIPVQFFRLRHQ